MAHFSTVRHFQSFIENLDEICSIQIICVHGNLCYGQKKKNPLNLSEKIDKVARYAFDDISTSYFILFYFFASQTHTHIFFWQHYLHLKLLTLANYKELTPLELRLTGIYFLINNICIQLFGLDGLLLANWIYVFYANISILKNFSLGPIIIVVY